MERDISNIAVLLGGNSNEREISIRSGNAISDALERKGFKVDKIDGVLDNVRNLDSNLYDVVFIALHGGSGEDGTIQKILEDKEICYTGSCSCASRLAMNKELSKDIFISNNIPTPQSYSLDTILHMSQFPFILKPINEGSSIGLYFIQNKDEFNSLKIDPASYMVEEYIKGREFTVSILQDKLLPIIEICPSNEVFNFESKYVKGNCSYIENPVLEEKVKQEMQELSLKVFKVLGCYSYGRVDLILDENNNVFILEINTIPGFTPTSLLPKAAKLAGIPFDDLCEAIVYDAKNKEKFKTKKT